MSLSLSLSVAQLENTIHASDTYQNRHATLNEDWLSWPKQSRVVSAISLTRTRSNSSRE